MEEPPTRVLHHFIKKQKASCGTISFGVFLGEFPGIGDDNWVMINLLEGYLDDLLKSYDNE